MRVLVVGGGTSGLISALILKRFLNIDVDVVYSKNIGIIGVGEGSTEHFNDFMNFVGIDYFSIIKECGATFKSGIMFEGWTEEPYLHSVGAPFSNKIGQYPYVYSRQISNNSNRVNSQIIWDNKLSEQYLNSKKVAPFNQYHFDTHKLNDFLIKFANKAGINTIVDDVKDVVFKETGEIDYVVGDIKTYNYDFYIDSTGFKRLLIGKMGARWVSFSEFLKMKSAVVFQTPTNEEYDLWTLAKAMDYGWRFQLTTQDHIGNGYVFDSDYVSLDKIKEELDKEMGFDVNIAKTFSFDPGHLETPWVKNCVAVGLSGSFVEPLEATSIGTTIQQTYLLMHKLLNYSEKDISVYNRSFTSIMNNLRDFIFLHYITKKETTDFWKDVRGITPPDSLSNKLELWKNKLPIKEDFLEQSQYSLFWEDNFTVVMHGLNLFNTDSIRAEYNALSNDFKNIADQQVINLLNTETGISHKKFIQTVTKYLI
jgi:flavin-dependent dehydrogenase